MKLKSKLIIVIIIIVFIIILDYITFGITKESIKQMGSEIDNILNSLDSNVEEAIYLSSFIEDDWKKLEIKMNYYLEHDELEKASVRISILNTQIKINDIEQAKENIMEIKFYLDHIEEKPKIKISNIF